MKSSLLLASVVGALICSFALPDTSYAGVRDRIKKRRVDRKIKKVSNDPALIACRADIVTLENSLQAQLDACVAGTDGDQTSPLFLYNAEIAKADAAAVAGGAVSGLRALENWCQTKYGTKDCDEKVAKDQDKHCDKKVDVDAKLNQKKKECTKVAHEAVLKCNDAYDKIKKLDDGAKDKGKMGFLNIVNYVGLHNAEFQAAYAVKISDSCKKFNKRDARRIK